MTFNQKFTDLIVEYDVYKENLFKYVNNLIDVNSCLELKGVTMQDVPKYCPVELYTHQAM